MRLIISDDLRERRQIASLRLTQIITCIYKGITVYTPNVLPPV